MAALHKEGSKYSAKIFVTSLPSIGLSLSIINSLLFLLPFLSKVFFTLKVFPKCSNSEEIINSSASQFKLSSMVP